MHKKINKLFNCLLKQFTWTTWKLYKFKIRIKFCFWRTKLRNWEMLWNQRMSLKSSWKKKEEEKKNCKRAEIKRLRRQVWRLLVLRTSKRLKINLTSSIFHKIQRLLDFYFINLKREKQTLVQMRSNKTTLKSMRLVSIKDIAPSCNKEKSFTSFQNPRQRSLLMVSKWLRSRKLNISIGLCLGMQISLNLLFLEKKLLTSSEPP